MTYILHQPKPSGEVYKVNVGKMKVCWDGREDEPPGPLFCINWCRVCTLVNEKLVGSLAALTNLRGRDLLINTRSANEPNYFAQLGRLFLCILNISLIFWGFIFVFWGVPSFVWLFMVN